MSRFVLWMVRAVMAVLAFCASVGPKDVQSNVSHWLDLIGARGLAEKLSQQRADPILLTIALVVMVATFIGPWLYRRWNGGEKSVESAEEQLPGPLYLSPTPPIDGLSYKIWIVRWEPEFFDLEFRGEPFVGGPPQEPKEQHPTFELLNAGPEDVRHVEITWSMPEVDLPSLVQESAVFGDYLDSVDGSCLRFRREGRGTVTPAWSSIRELPIPMIRAGDKLMVRSPQAFTAAFTAFALATAKQHHDKTPLPDPRDDAAYLRHLEAMRQPVGAIAIQIDYIAGQQRRSQRFRVCGALSGGSAGLSRRRREDGFYAASKGSVQASVDYVQVIPQ